MAYSWWWILSILLHTEAVEEILNKKYSKELLPSKGRRKMRSSKLLYVQIMYLVCTTSNQWTGWNSQLMLNSTNIESQHLPAWINKVPILICTLLIFKTKRRETQRNSHASSLSYHIFQTFLGLKLLTLELNLQRMKMGPWKLDSLLRQPALRQMMEQHLKS